MVWRRSASQGSHEPFLILGCVGDGFARKRIEAAVSGLAMVEWESDFGSLRTRLSSEQRRIAVLILDTEEEGQGSATAFARDVAESHAGVGIVAFRKPALGSEAEAMLLGAAGVHDALISGLTDHGFTARTILLNACRAGAGDVVIAALRTHVPKRLMPYVQTAIRNPSKNTIGLVAAYLGVHRQTPNSWCRKEGYLRAEELLIWARLLLAGALLEMTSRTLESIAIELDYASPTSLRNQLKSYTGFTSTEIRTRGFRVLLEVFLGRVAQHKAGLSGSPADQTPALNEPAASGRLREL